MADEKKVNLRIGLDEYTVYVDEILTPDTGECPDCATTHVVDLYSVNLQIKEIRDEDGKELPVNGTVARRAVKKIYRASRGDAKRCERHFLRFYRGIPNSIC